MKNAADAEAQELEEAEENKRITDSHWRLSFRDPPPNISKVEIIYAPSYTSFTAIASNGRRIFGQEHLDDPEDEDEQRQKATNQVEPENETAEDEFARRQAEKETDRENLRRMKGLSGISGSKRGHPNSDKDRNRDGDKIGKRKKRSD